MKKEEEKSLCPYYEGKCLRVCVNKFNGDFRSSHNIKKRHRCLKMYCPLDLNSPDEYQSKGDE